MLTSESIDQPLQNRLLCDDWGISRIDKHRGVGIAIHLGPSFSEDGVKFSIITRLNKNIRNTFLLISGD